MTSPAAIEPFNPGSYAEKLRDKIKSALVDIVPDEQWEALIKREIETFFEKQVVRRDYNGFHSSMESSPFQVLAQQILTEEARKHIIKMLEAPEWADVWNDGQIAAGERVSKLLVENAQAIIVASVGSAFQVAMQHLRNSASGRGY